MPSLTIGLDEELSDQRSNQVAYKLSIENTSTQVIHLQSVNPQLPVAATLHEVTDISLAQTSARRASLITGLNDLLGGLWVSSEEFRKLWVQQSKGEVERIEEGKLRFSSLRRRERNERNAAIIVKLSASPQKG